VTRRGVWNQLTHRKYNYSALANLCNRLLTLAHIKSPQFVFNSHRSVTVPNNSFRHHCLTANSLLQMSTLILLKIQRQSHIPTDGQSAKPCAPRPDFGYCQMVAVLSTWGASSAQWTGLSFNGVQISRTCHLYVYLQFYNSAFYNVNRPVHCAYPLFRNVYEL
jgi:hypothetical protein